MKRYLPVSLVFCALAIAGPAAAAERVDYRGAGDEPAVGFTAKIRDGEVVKVTKFKFFNIVLTCDGGATIVVDNDRSPLPGMKVDDNRFGDSFTSNNGQRVKVGGKFSKGGRVAKGNLRIRGDFTDQTGMLLTNCDSGKVQWEAR